MKDELTSRSSATPASNTAHSRWLRLLIAGCLLVILVGINRHSHHHDSAPGAVSPNTADSSETGGNSAAGHGWRISRNISHAAAPTAEEIVTSKVSQFARSRREMARAMGRRANKEVPPEVEAFFDAVEAGRWEEIEARFAALSKRSGQYEGSTYAPDLNPFWMAVLDAYGVAEQAHEWPAQKLLDYGNAVLGSLRPGMVYVGGTDNGRWIPELLNDTSSGEQHIMVTQNAFADGRYIEFMSTLYGDRLATLTDDDSKRAFQEYVSDAQKRLEHDEQFPDEPKQIRPGENVSVVDGKVQVGGQVAVMAINEKLLQTMMAKNPDLSFAIQESFPLRGTYANALPLGPLMELRAADGQNTFTAERAAQSLDYWRNTAQQILSDAEAAGSSAALKSYSHDTVAAANLLAAHDFTVEAEQAYRLAAQFWPENPEPVGGLADLLVRAGREVEARQVFEEFTRQHPNQQKNLERVSASWRMIGTARPGGP